MPMDGLTLSIIANDLSNTLTDGRIDKIAQPERDELILTVRSGGKNHLLLLSASAGNARAQLTALRKTGPLEPPSLCMLMRKRISGGRIASIRQLYCDRILEINVEHYNELGDKTNSRILCEFMGKHSNLIFIGKDERIIDSARHVSEAMSSVREVLPGLRYEDPPAHGKIPFAEADAQRICAALQGQNGALWKVLSREISGLSPQTAREIAFRVCGDSEGRLDEMDAFTAAEKTEQALKALLGAHSPCVYFSGDQPVDFGAWPLLSRPDLRSEAYPTLWEAMDAFYQTRDTMERIGQKSAAIRRTLKTNIERCERKLALQREALLGSERMDEYRLKGELLTANLALPARGQKSVMLPNYYEDGMPMIEVELDEKLSPAQNAQRYFKLYQKARSAQTLAAEQIRLTTEELDYLDGQLDNLSKCTGEADLAEVRQELEKAGYVKANHNRRQMKQLPPSAPMRFRAPDGTAILVGKNNTQNDKLTFTAQPDETWLHAKDMPGSHVIVVGAEPSDIALKMAARLAAAYSKGADSTRVPVDYTLRKYVKKPAGAKPGFVIYTHQHTLFVQPDHDSRPEN